MYLIFQQFHDSRTSVSFCSMRINEIHFEKNNRKVEYYLNYVRLLIGGVQRALCIIIQGHDQLGRQLMKVIRKANGITIGLGWRCMEVWPQMCRALMRPHLNI